MNWAAVLVLAGVATVAAQSTPLDIRVSIPILNDTGAVLPGTLTNFGCANAPGGVVQILMVGSNNVAHLPNLDGTPSGGDTILFATVIGDYNGLNPCTLGHQLDTSFSPRPATGTKIYARVFDASPVSSAAYWGQSPTYTVTNSPAVFDFSAAGLKATTMPKGVDLTTTLDGKGRTYYTDLIANIDPQDPTDLFGTSGLTGSNNQVSLIGHVGRMYALQRSLELTLSNGWTNVTTTAVLSTNQDNTTLILADPSPTNTPKAFYRVKITMP